MAEGNSIYTSFLSTAKSEMHFKKLKQIVLITLICLLTLLPIFFIVSMLATTGSDSISNDYLRFTNLADRVLTDGYDWRGYLKDSFDNNVHSYAFLFLLRLVLAELTHLSVFAEIYLGLAITSVNLLLIFLIFNRFSGSTSALRFLLLPFLSALTFSFSQISSYSYGEVALQRGITHLGILTAVWMLLFKSKSSFTPWVMLICGILASFSGAGGLLAWPVFLFAIIITKTGKLNKYITWLAGLGISLSPYLFFSNINPLNRVFNPLIINRVITGLGLPFANNINYGVQDHPDAFLSGLIGIGVLFFCLILLFLSKSKHRFRIAIPSLIIIFWGLAGAVQIGLVRSMLAPWYTSEYMVFWLGLFGLCFGMIWPDIQPAKRIFIFPEWDKVIQFAGFSGVFVIILLYLLTNLTYADKSFYLPSRSPTSSACLRNYPTSPTYCEGFVFQWGVGNPAYMSQMASVLDKYHWSVLGPQQEWTLQGDYILGNVSLVSQTGTDQIRWVRGELDEPSFWADYHHLNVLLSPGQSILWQIDLPPNLSNAKLTMGLSLTEKNICQGQNFSIRFETSSGSKKSVFQQQGLCNFINEVSLSENLFDFAGTPMVIRITNESNPDGGKAIRLHYPRVLIDEIPVAASNPFTPLDVRPSNTDLSANFLPLNSTGSNSQFLSIANPAFQDLQLENGGGLLTRNGPAPSIRYTPLQPICLQNWSRLYFGLALTESVQKRTVRIGIQFQDGGQIPKETILDFPLLAGDSLHAYTLDFELLNLPYSACITNIEFRLFDGTKIASDQWVKIINVGFLQRTTLRFGFLPQVK